MALPSPKNHFLTKITSYGWIEGEIHCREQKLIDPAFAPAILDLTLLLVNSDFLIMLI